MAEKFDSLQNFIFINSMAGGTGSGLGSYALSVLKDTFPKVAKTNFLVAPKQSGEVIL